ncbi:MAG: helicase-exonuclease AddAB subunit AddA [Blautia sp.]|nr:helicase-exonuclease AddAB subunit AddA [Blautia sp.]
MEACEEDGPQQYIRILQEEMEQTKELLACVSRGYEAFARCSADIAFSRLPGRVTASNGMDLDPRKKELAKKYRDEAKAILDSQKKSFALLSEEEIIEASREMEGPLLALVRLTIEFSHRFAGQKREKGVLDFSDLEHYALQILREKDGDGWRMSDAARELSLKYDEVMVDEYQDSNQVQEEIASCVSGWASDRKNVFMVGDVKQSIYRFRQAKPELFLEKYRTYTQEDSLCQKVDLHKNFRSRPCVLESVNYLCRQIMGEDLGGVSYDEAAALYPGADFPKDDSEKENCTELLLFPTEDEDMPGNLSGREVQELEALMIARRIRRLLAEGQIYDAKQKAYRPVKYRDIVILLRTFTGWGETFMEVLSSQGIPVYALSRTGYFSAAEVVTLLNYLDILANPMQDIPLAGVLRSRIADVSAQELALLRSRYPAGYLYESIQRFLEDGQLSLFGNDGGNGFGRDPEEEALVRKLSAFMDTLKELRRMTAYTPVHQLITEVLARTGFDCLVRALPDGEQRYANLSMLVAKAMEYEKTSYRGLYHFIRYIRQLEKYEVDFGEVNTSGGSQNAVQIMTIHRSKGLEFPVVFVSGLGKNFNFMDVNAAFLIHSGLGAAMDYVDPDRRIRIPALQKQVLRRQLLSETLGEELRVLYVAMTRAKEKLILTGTIGDTKAKLSSLVRFIGRKEELLPISVRRKAKTYLDYILPALCGHRCMEELFSSNGILDRGDSFLRDDVSDFQVRIVSPASLVVEETQELMQEEGDRLLLKDWDPALVRDAALREEIRKRFTYVYPYKELGNIPVKVSVSDLKKRSWHEDSEKEENILKEKELLPVVPRFIREMSGEEKQEEQFTGADRGTAYHRVMECLDYHSVSSREELHGQVERMVREKRLSSLQAACVKAEDIQAFLDTQLGKRMETAGKNGLLLREQPFMIERTAAELSPEWQADTGVLVQGIIDAYFLEGEDIVLVDYKTDKVRPGEEQKLIDLYHIQLEDYALALERMTGRRVKETFIYSFALHKEIPLAFP